jgi:hypothetical protein
VVRDCGQSELKSLTKVALASVTGHPWIVFRIASGLAEVDQRSQREFDFQASGGVTD